MPTVEYPQIATGCYSSTNAAWNENPLFREIQCGQPATFDLQIDALNKLVSKTTQPTQEIMANTTQRRIVQVFIADPNDNVPLDSSLLYRGEQKLTDCNDQELFFEIPIADTLKKHNEFRKNVLDKEASKKAGKDVYLEPARIRDLKMTVVTIATF